MKPAKTFAEPVFIGLRLKTFHLCRTHPALMSGREIEHRKRVFEGGLDKFVLEAEKKC